MIRGMMMKNIETRILDGLTRRFERGEKDSEAPE
tara:strand:+ start:239 stop:340 length:102 start_codon:yes stop_codon:yes gene_type:complete